MIPNDLYAVLIEASRVIWIVGGLTLGVIFVSGLATSVLQSLLAINENAVAYAGRVFGFLLCVFFGWQLIQNALTSLYLFALGG